MGRAGRAAVALVVGVASISNALASHAVTIEPIVYECPGTPDERPVLSLGSKHRCVGYLEQFLKRYDHVGAKSLRPNTSFGRLTRHLVKQMQSDLGVDEDDAPRGTVGAKTWAAIDTVVDAQANSGFSDVYSNVHFYGASHLVRSRKVLRRALDAAGIHDVTISAVSATATTFGHNNALERLRAHVKRGSIPDLIVMNTGVNDAKMLKRVSRSFAKLEDPAEIKAAARGMFDEFVRDFMAYVDGLAAPPDVLWVTSAQRNPNYERDDWFNESLKAEQVRRAELADPALARLTVVDFGSTLVTHPKWFVSDGVHLTPVGYRVRSRCIVDALLAYETFGDQTVIRCP